MPVAAAALAIVGGLAICGVRSSAAQEIRVGVSAYTPQAVHILANSNLVPLDVVVRRSDGSVVAGLRRRNFRLLNDGRPERLTQFSVVLRRSGEPPGALPKPPPAGPGSARGTAPSPRYVALWFDDVNTAGADLKHARNAALAFLSQGRDSGEHIGLFTASGAQRVMFTTDFTSIVAAVRRVSAHPRASQYGLQSSCPYIGPFEAYQIAVLHLEPALDAATAEYGRCMGGAVAFDNRSQFKMDATSQMPVLAQADATWNLTRGISEDTLQGLGQVISLLAREGGRRMLLLVSGGFLSQTMDAQMQAMINRALHARIVINAIDAKGLFTMLGQGRPASAQFSEGVLPLVEFFYQQQTHLTAQSAKNDVMVRLAQSTGGLFFHNSNDLELGFERVGLVPAVTYALAFVPVSLPHDGKFHRLKIELIPPIKGAIIQARRGYFDPPPDSAGAVLGQEMQAAMQDTAVANSLPASVTLRPAAGKVGVDVQFNVARLPFDTAHRIHRQLLVVIAGLFRSGGQFVSGKRGTLELQLRAASYKRLRSHGLGATLWLTAPPGSYRLRVVVGEAVKGEISAFDRTVVVRPR